MEETEIWKKIEGYDNYEISTFGNVRNIISNNLLKLSKKGNYYSIGLTDKNKNRKSFRVHRLVCMTFISNPDNKAEKGSGIPRARSRETPLLHRLFHLNPDAFS